MPKATKTYKALSYHCDGAERCTDSSNGRDRNPATLFLTSSRWRVDHRSVTAAGAAEVGSSGTAAGGVDGGGHGGLQGTEGPGHQGSCFWASS